MLRTSTTAFRILIAVALAAFGNFAAARQPYPTKAIRFIVPFPPGGTTTPLARLTGQRLTDRWGQPVIVDNRPGGNTVIGTEALVKSPADGYTILLVSPPFVVAPSLLPSLPYDTVKDFAPVATLALSEQLLVVHPSVPANTLGEFIALAKSKPGQLNYASSGSGGSTHLTAARFEILTGVKLQHIPYKGGGPATADLIGGHVQLFFNTPINFISHVKDGKLKAIAISGSTRLSVLPQVPTFAEAGLPGLDVTNWFGVVAPAGTPRPIIDRMSSEIAAILAMPDIKEKLAAQGLDLFISTPEQFAALIRADLAKFAKIIKAANIKLDQ